MHPVHIFGPFHNKFSDLVSSNKKTHGKLPYTSNSMHAPQSSKYAALGYGGTEHVQTLSASSGQYKSHAFQDKLLAFGKKNYFDAIKAIYT